MPVSPLPHALDNLLSMYLHGFKILGNFVSSAHGLDWGSFLISHPCAFTPSKKIPISLLLLPYTPWTYVLHAVLLFCFFVGFFLREIFTFCKMHTYSTPINQLCKSLMLLKMPYTLHVTGTQQIQTYKTIKTWNCWQNIKEYRNKWNREYLPPAQSSSPITRFPYISPLLLGNGLQCMQSNSSVTRTIRNLLV